MNYKKVLDRRTFLKGVGGTIIGLPLLDEMRVKSVYAAAPDSPNRAFNIFFGLGYQRNSQKEGFVAPNGWMSPLEPLMVHEKKLAFLRGVNQIRANGSSNAHYDGSSGAFTGTGMKNFNTTGGISIDEALRRHSHPNGMPAGMIQTLQAGTWWRRSDSTTRYIHSRKPDGSIVNRPFETPRSLFNHVFGGQLPSDNVDPATAREIALKKSVLDSVVDQYQHFQSDAGGLGGASRAKIADHLDHVRALELQVASIQSFSSCPIPQEPGNSVNPKGDPQNGDGTKLTNDGDGIDITLERLSGEFRAIADIYALAIACDRARFGSLLFQSGGERIRLKGDYSYGNTKYSFDDRAVRGRGGSGGCSHEYWHIYQDGGKNEHCRAHQHLMFREISYFLGLLDNIVDENDGTVLDNSMTTISTESADGRHKTADFELNGVFHAVTGCGGRIKTGNGDFIDVNDHASNIYNTMLRSFGASGGNLVGDGRGDLSSIKA